MPTLTNKVLCANLTTTANTTILTASAGETIRIIRAQATAGENSGTIFMGVHDSSVNVTGFLANGGNISATGYWEFGNIILETGDSFRAWIDGATGTTILLCYVVEA